MIAIHNFLSVSVLNCSMSLGFDAQQLENYRQGRGCLMIIFFGEKYPRGRNQESLTQWTVETHPGSGN